MRKWESALAEMCTYGGTCVSLQKSRIQDAYLCRNLCEALTLQFTTHTTSLAHQTDTNCPIIFIFDLEVTFFLVKFRGYFENNIVNNKSDTLFSIEDNLSLFVFLGLKLFTYLCLDRVTFGDYIIF